jgi:hypothetical protein
MACKQEFNRIDKMHKTPNGIKNYLRFNRAFISKKVMII